MASGGLFGRQSCGVSLGTLFPIYLPPEYLLPAVVRKYRTFGLLNENFFYPELCAKARIALSGALQDYKLTNRKYLRLYIATVLVNEM